VAESGAEAPLDESILKKDPAAEKEPDAGAVDSDKAKTMFAARAPSLAAVFWSKFPRPTDPPTAPTSVTPALKNPAKAAVDKPVTEDSPALGPPMPRRSPPRVLSTMPRSPSRKRSSRRYGSEPRNGLKMN